MPIDFAPTENYEVKASEHPCLICGQQTFEWGVVSRFSPMSYRRGFRFFRDDPTLGVKARHCVTCDHIQLFADPDLSNEQQRAAIWVYGAWFVAIVLAVSVVTTLLGG
jgi:hypothetical protein